MKVNQMKNLIAPLKIIQWFSKCGETTDDCVMVSSIFDAFDRYGAQMSAVWEPEISTLENKARGILTDESIDGVFDCVSNMIQDGLWAGYCQFIERCRLEAETGLEHEILDCVKRDMSWFVIECWLGRKGFFNKLFSLYERGRWPCSYKGVYPDGKFIVM